MNRMPRCSSRFVSTIVLSACASMLAVVAGCSDNPQDGYSFATTHRTDVTSIAVPMFGNNTQTYGLEQELTAAVVSELRRTTPYKILDVDAAQTQLTGTITDSKLRKLSTARDTGLSETLAVELTVEFSWKNTRTGKVLVARRNFVSSESFTPSRGVGERIEVGQNASISKLARDIVAEMRSGW